MSEMDIKSKRDAVILQSINEGGRWGRFGGGDGGPWAMNQMSN